jgi:hypothetical protein
VYRRERDRRSGSLADGGSPSTARARRPGFGGEPDFSDMSSRSTDCAPARERRPPPRLRPTLAAPIPPGGHRMRPACRSMPYPARANSSVRCRQHALHAPRERRASRVASSPHVSCSPGSSHVARSQHSSSTPGSSCSPAWPCSPGSSFLASSRHASSSPRRASQVHGTCRHRRVAPSGAASVGRRRGGGRRSRAGAQSVAQGVMLGSGGEPTKPMRRARAVEGNPPSARDPERRPRSRRYAAASPRVPSRSPAACPTFPVEAKPRPAFSVEAQPRSRSKPSRARIGLRTCRRGHARWHRSPRPCRAGHVAWDI